MKIVFMGTPEFARLPLEHLYRCANHDIAAVVTGRDKPSGRGRKVVPTAVKAAAEKLGLPVMTPAKLKDESFLDEIRSIETDIFVVVAFRILPEVLFTIPEFGAINLHGSLLPKYRGAAPINWALINGETETGLTTFQLKKKVDTGDMLYQKKIAIRPDETFDELYARMSEMAGPVLEKTLDLIESGKAKPIPQDNSLASPAPKLSPFDAQIDWGFPAGNVINFVRGMSSIPGAFTTFRGRRMKVLKASECTLPVKKECRPGSVIEDKQKLLISVADGAVEIIQVQPEGKGKMTGEQFLRGYRPNSSDILGERIEQD
jgi:methionyl-tRNA formyltransferase